MLRCGVALSLGDVGMLFFGVACSLAVAGAGGVLLMIEEREVLRAETADATSWPRESEEVQPNLLRNARKQFFEGLKSSARGGRNNNQQIKINTNLCTLQVIWITDKDAQDLLLELIRHQQRDLVARN